jgi:hypothetical protein
MTIDSALSTITKMPGLAIPKEAHSYERVKRILGEPSGETTGAWVVACTHVLTNPATAADIKGAEDELGFGIPEEYRRLLRISNGASLFVVPQIWLHDTFPGAQHVQYRLFGTEELVDTHSKLLGIFRDNYADDPELRHVMSVNYLAICDATDGNYQAILLQGPEHGKVFLLLNELLGRPYSEGDRDLYYTIADSLENWLQLISDTGGWGGRGQLTGGL